MREIFAVAIIVVALSGCGSPAGRGHDVQSGRGTVMMPPAVATAHPDAANPTITDGDKYHVILENERVRVLEFRDQPGAITHQHSHPDSVLVTTSAYTRKITFGDGTTKTRSFAAGDVVWIPAQTHVGENVGTSDSHAILIELK